MFQLKPGSMAMIIGARTASGRRNIGKSVELLSEDNKVVHKALKL